jgi:hypothetical protein
MAMNGALQVSTQGISQDWSQANGDYDTIERGTIDAQELEGLLQRVQALQELDYSGDDDLCPPGVYIEGPAGQVALYMSEGKLYETESNVEVTPHEAVALAIGQEPGVAAQVAARGAAQAEAEAEANRAPVVRKPEVPPTPLDLDASSIDTGPNAPQIGLQVWKSSNWIGMAYSPWIVGAFFLFVGVLGLGGGDTGMGIVMLLIAVGLAFLHAPLKKAAKVTFRVGCDWATNTIWAVRDQELVGAAPDANTVTDVAYDVTETGGSGMVFTGDGAVATGSDRSYPLYVLRGEDRIERLGEATLYSKKDANAVAVAAGQMLGSSAAGVAPPAQPASPSVAAPSSAPAPPPQAAAPTAPAAAQTPPAPPKEQPKTDADAMAQLEKLADLKEKGVISEEEFETKKKELLGRI